jgi:hypothetical protein
MHSTGLTPESNDGGKYKSMSEMLHADEKPSLVLRLCAVQGCCPEVDFTDSNQVILTDDFGGKVTLTNEQFSLLKSLQDPR